MNKCLFYRVNTRTVRNSEMHQGARDNVIRIPWCSHKHSPIEKSIVTEVCGSANVLHCLGNLEKCQVSKENFGDFGE